MNFTEQDLENCIKFGKFVGEHAKFDVTTQQVIEFSRLLVWYNSLAKKVEDHIMEVKAVHNMKKNEQKVNE